MNLLLLRGLVRDQRAWGEFPARLEANAPHLKPWFLDLPGVGTECARECPNTITGIRVDLAKRFHERIARGKLPPGPWSLLAISLGGMVALDWAAAEPRLFQNLTIINSSAADVAGFAERFPLRHVPELVRALVTLDPRRTERLMMKMASNRHGELAHLLDQQIAWRRERPVSRKTFLRQLSSAAKFRLPDDRLSAKTLVISSAGDRMVSPKASERIAQRLGAPKVTHPWAGHDIAIDDPEWLARRVAEFLPDPSAPRAAFRT